MHISPRESINNPTRSPTDEFSASCHHGARAVNGGGEAHAPSVVPDAAYPGMWRVQWPDGRLSDMANLTRAKDAAACFMETAKRRHRGRQRPVEAPPMRLNGRGAAQ